jgi:uncharacterized protein (DUF952 family)
MINHLADPQAWAAALASDTRTYHAASLQTEKFIHLSTGDQVPHTFALFYPDRTDLVLLDVDETHPDVAPLLKWEPAPTGELFPHLYGPLPLDAVIRARPHWRPTPIPRSERFPFGAGYDDGSATYDLSTFDWRAVEAALVDARNYWITSVRPDGRPHAVPVWGIWLGDVLGFSSGPNAVKSRNLRSNPKCVAHLESGDTTVILEGTVEPMTGLELDAFVAGYLPKYGLELDTSNPDFGFYRMVPSTARTWLEKAFLQSATLWTFDRQPG